jgi:hemerythrin-like domain-containing protein
MEHPMATSKHATSNAKDEDAIALLTADHKKVKALFKDFEKLKEQEDAGDEKAALVERICMELMVHATVEEEIFYPAVRDAINDDDLVDEAEVEHASAKDLIAQLQSAEPGDEQYDARVTVLGEYVDHHVKEEEGEMFPKARKKVDVAALGAEIADRKAELMADMAMDESPDEEAGMPAKAGGKEAGTARKATARSTR